MSFKEKFSQSVEQDKSFREILKEQMTVPEIAKAEKITHSYVYRQLKSGAAKLYKFVVKEFKASPFEAYTTLIHMLQITKLEDMEDLKSYLPKDVQAEIETDAAKYIRKK